MDYEYYEEYIKQKKIIRNHYKDISNPKNRLFFELDEMINKEIANDENIINNLNEVEI